MAKRIKDRGIRWKEVYRDKSRALRERYDEEIGRNAYMRWEGYDATTGSTYYVVVGPGYSKEKGKLFFAGIRKMPADYAPAGEYYPTMQAASKHAKDKWGVPAPIMASYTQRDLVDIHIPGEAKEGDEAKQKYRDMWKRITSPRPAAGGS